MKQGRRHNEGCCCLKTYPEGITHECICGCIQLVEPKTTDGEVARLGNDLLAWLQERNQGTMHSAGACAMVLVAIVGKEGAHSYVDVVADHDPSFVTDRAAPARSIGEPVEITPGESFEVEMPIPPLRRPALELLIETLEAKDEDGVVVERRYCVRLADKDVRIGLVTVCMLDLLGTDTDKQKAIDKLTTQAGKGVAQAYVKLLASDNPEEVAAARAMEIGS